MEAIHRRQACRSYKLSRSLEAYSKDEFQIWFIEFHARKESLGIAELTKYLDERLCKLNG
ncbi:MAG: hypothetical protein FWH22_03490 [Fibromonadales bacterium]|nr:hypothetical protein [Fibromonadales bacterium]